MVMPLTALSILMFYILHLTKPNQINYAVFRGVSTCLNTFFFLQTVISFSLPITVYELNVLQNTETSVTMIKEITVKQHQQYTHTEKWHAPPLLKQRHN